MAQRVVLQAIPGSRFFGASSANGANKVVHAAKFDTTNTHFDPVVPVPGSSYHNPNSGAQPGNSVVNLPHFFVTNTSKINPTVGIPGALVQDIP